PSPLELDQAALETAVGGSFFPGIEASWLFASGRLFGAPLRLRRGAVIRRGSAIGDVVVEPGIMTAQMALPWHSDFAQCRMAPTPTTLTNVGWWPTQRPDNVYVRGAGGAVIQKRWAAADAWVDGGARNLDMVDHWSSHGFVVEGPEGEFFEAP